MVRCFAGGHLRYQNGAWYDDDGDLVEIYEANHGNWLYSSMANPAFRVCDQCGSAFRIDNLDGEFNFCPSCGTDMRKCEV